MYLPTLKVHLKKNNKKKKKTVNNLSNNAYAMFLYFFFFFFLIFFIKAYVVGTNLNWTDNSMHFKWVPTRAGYRKK